MSILPYSNVTKYFPLIFILSRLLVCVLIQIITTILHYLPLCVSIGIKHSEKQSIGRQLNNTNKKKNNFKYIKLPSEQIEFTPTMLPLNRGSHAKIFKALRWGRHNTAAPYYRDTHAAWRPALTRRQHPRWRPSSRRPRNATLHCTKHRNKTAFSSRLARI